MSENLVHTDPAIQIPALALMADADCADFQHEVLNSESSYTGGVATTIFTITVPPNAAFIMTSLDIEMVPDITDAAFDKNDFRSTDDLNPYGSQFALSVGSGTVVINFEGQGIFRTANGIGVINTPFILVFLAGTITINVDPQSPPLKVLTSSNRVTGYLVPEAIGSTLKKKESRFNTATGATGVVIL